MVDGNVYFHVSNGVLEKSKSSMCCVRNNFNKSVGTVTIFGPDQFTQFLLSLIVYNRRARVLLQAVSFHTCRQTESPYRQ
jgi:hypothetical protein